MKIFYILFFIFLLIPSAFWSEDLKIISREEWGANENYRFADSKEWQDIFKKRAEVAINNKNIKYSDEEIAKQKARAKKVQEMNNILVNDYWEYIAVESVKKYENGRKLAWPITKTKKVWWIVIHHTAVDYEDSWEWIKKIYKYHALTRKWWDIWYNYLIWNNWEIYEWRAGWDYVVWAQDKRNNMWTVWIAIIWNYSEKAINKKQYDSLKKLSLYLLKKYNIDLTEKTYFHEECFWDSCKKPLLTKKMYPIIWHRDAWHTSCPWDKLYAQINNMRRELLKEPIFVKKLLYKRIFPKLVKFKDEQLIDILAKVESRLDINKTDKDLTLKDLLISYFDFKKKKSDINNKIENKKIRVKLSYPNNDFISIRAWKLVFDIKRVWNQIEIKWTKFDKLTIPKNYPSTILTITSWDRKPTWDTSWKYNDNLFKGDLTIYVKNDRLVLVNTLDVEDYLKWLWEVSDFENKEKIKTIIVAARSYANYYIDYAKKFPDDDYDASDDPNVFQKYLWYWLEKRSPNINRIVDETKWQVITYKWKMIKPWYFSSSNWKTLSFYEYCILKYSNMVCSLKARNYPYLQSVVDKWSDWMVKRGHGVWISWAWVTYFAEKWWTYDMIIKYFLKWVEIM